MLGHFSQNNLILDVKNAFGKPTISHWRPIDNLYYLTTGKIFGKSYFGYHTSIFLLHITTSLLLFLIFKKLFLEKSAALFSSIIYATHPAHFIALFWISGATVNIGFFFLCLAIYCLLSKKGALAVSFYLLALLASESMIAGSLIMIILLIFKKALSRQKVLILFIFLVTLLFIVLRFLFFMSKVTSDVYRLEFSAETFWAFKYYFLRVLGFLEGHGKSFLSVLLVFWLFALGFANSNQHWIKTNWPKLLLAAIIIFIGFFPFILIPSHLSSHYVSISIWGYSMLCGILIKKVDRKFLFFFVLVFLFVSYISIRLNMKNSWVIYRSDLARRLIANIEKGNLPPGSSLTFDNSQLASSKEQYLALGSGEAINFWFKDKGYKTCFSFFENCPEKFVY